MTQNTEERGISIRRKEEEDINGRGPGSGPAARGPGAPEDGKERKTSKSFSIPENFATSLKIASALSGREQSDIIVQATTPLIREIMEQNREIFEDLLSDPQRQ